MNELDRLCSEIWTAEDRRAIRRYTTIQSVCWAVLFHLAVVIGFAWAGLI